MKKLLIIPILLITLTLFSQYKPGKAGGGLYNTGQNSIDKGWYFGIGATYMIGYLTQKASFTTDTLGNTYRNDYVGDPCGNFGPYFEIGKFKMNDKKFINYQDYGIAYKWFRGGEDYTNEFFVNDVLTTTTTAEGTYSDHLVSAHYNIGYRFDATDDMYYVNGIGANFDYAFIKSRSGTAPIPSLNYVDGPGSMFGEIHYFFGMGFKTGKRLIIMPMIETPIFAILPFNHIVSTHNYFNSRARRLIFRVRIMFLKKGSKSCPAVFNPMGIDPNGNRQK
ncbi:MAG: hypothetical protein COA97_13445 [Flavobacteriales bacterium]|nr:MAG: hypothetical protein COA97_13445 [Flavobacteriales bacterium]